MTFHDSYGVVKRKPKGYGKEGKEQFDVIHKIIKAATLYTFIGKPITDKKNNGAYDKEAGYFKNPT